MTEEKRKSRMISLRVSDAEYAKLKQIYRVRGTRSISDFARISMQRAAALEEGTLGSDLLLRIDNLDARVDALEASLSSFQARAAADR